MSEAWHLCRDKGYAVSADDLRRFRFAAAER